MLHARVESFALRMQELAPHWGAHRELLAEPMLEALGAPANAMPLAPRLDAYCAMERRDELLLVVLRDDERLAGYWINFVGPGLHYASTAQAKMDIWYLLPEYRKGAAALILGRGVERALRSRGISLWTLGEKLHRPAGRLYAALGAKPIEQYWAKWLGD